MNVRLRLLKFYFPAFIKKKKLAQLFAITASAFNCEAPSIKGLSFEQSLHRFALFTKEQTERHFKRISYIDNVKNELFQEAYQLGMDLRREFNINSSNEILWMMKTIYNLLGINFNSGSENEIIISRCFFSQYYSPGVCRVISSLDEGLASGLSNGGQLSFYQRITDGHNCCRANFVLKEDVK